jgi:hypothetical protein
VSLTASFRGSKVRKKIVREKSKIYKNSQNAIKIKISLNYLKKKCLVMRIGWKMHYLQPITWFYDFFLRKTKIFKKIWKPTKFFFGRNKKNKCLMVLNDKPNFKDFDEPSSNFVRFLRESPYIRLNPFYPNFVFWRFGVFSSLNILKVG